MKKSRKRATKSKAIAKISHSVHCEGRQITVTGSKYQPPKEEFLEYKGLSVTSVPMTIMVFSSRKTAEAAFHAMVNDGALEVDEQLLLETEYTGGDLDRMAEALG